MTDGRARAAGPSSPEVALLLWHGRGAREADVFATLLRRLGSGVLVMTPQWDSSAADRGRAALLHSLDAAQDLARRHRCRLVLGGWSLGAAAAIEVGTAPELRHRVDAVLGLAADPRACSPIGGAAPAGTTTRGPGPAISLVHGADDEVVPVADVEALRRHLRALDHVIDLDVVTTDHAGVLGTRYSSSARRCLPSGTSTAVTGLDATVSAVHRIARRARDGSKGSDVRRRPPS